MKISGMVCSTGCWADRLHGCHVAIEPVNLVPAMKELGVVWLEEMYV